ncbi:DUF6090 family protein [Hanstruepera marina]|uniref:DUF6090 family protein n=1 Tax=Hanstruepera marina TaxID=2873265 RepID=UPI001CA6ABA4|nr:DUF6090 family protein [Hanstruepera marina]
MFKIFRKIRMNSVQSNKVKKYLLYALGEVLLIIIGILIALQLNNLNEDQKTFNNEKKTLELIKTNLQQEDTDFQRFISYRINPCVEYLLAVYNKEWNTISLDSIGLTGTAYFNYQPFNSAYQGLKSGGNLSLIKNDSLRDRIIYYYEKEYLHLKDWSEWHKNFVINTLEPYMYNELPINPQELVDDIDFLKEKLEERRLNSLISTQIGSFNRIHNEINVARGLIEELITIIDVEIRKRWD